MKSFRAPLLTLTVLLAGACDGGGKPAPSGPPKLTDAPLMSGDRVVSANTAGDTLTVMAERGPYSVDRGWWTGTAEAAMVVGRRLQLYDFPEERPEAVNLAVVVGPPGGPPVLRTVWSRDTLLAMKLDEESGTSFEQVMAAASAIEPLSEAGQRALTPCGSGTSVPCPKIAD